MSGSTASPRDTASPEAEGWTRAGQRRGWRRILLPAAALAVLAGGAVWLLLHEEHQAPQYRTATVAEGPVTAAVTASGTVNPVTMVQVGSQVSGQILSLHADFNSEVKSGEVIARIDPALIESQVRQAAADLDVARAAVTVQGAAVQRARADLAAARANLEGLQQQTRRAQVAMEDAARTNDRRQRLFATGAGSAADRDTAQAAHDESIAALAAAQAQEAAQRATIDSLTAALAVAEATLVQNQAQVGMKQAVLDNAQVNLEHTFIRAPVDGTVIQRAVDVGQTVAASLQAPTLFLIAQDLRRMQVDASVDEADVGAIREGQPVEFTVDAYPGRVFRGEVLQVRKNPQVVQNVVTYDAVLSAPNEDQALLPGLTATIRIVTARRDHALLVPNAALRWRPTGSPVAAPAPGTGTVFALGDDGLPRMVTLRLGISDGNVAEVTEGALQPGERLVIGEDASRAAAPAGSPGFGPPRF